MAATPAARRGMRIVGVEYELPATVLDNAELARRIPTLEADKIREKTGIRERRIAAPDEMASDLAERAAARLLARQRVAPEQVDFLIFCTQAPDYPLPTTACLLQRRLGLPTTCAALDMNLGCSGYIYALSLAYGYIASGLFRQGLVLTADTYSKYLEPTDRSVATIFGDGGAATLVAASDGPGVHTFVLGTDGSGEERLICRRGSLRVGAAAGGRWVETTAAAAPMYMDGPAIFSFALQRVPALVRDCLRRAEIDTDQVDLFIFHQANSYMLEALRRALRLPSERFVVLMDDTGNTGSPTIPIVLKRLVDAGRLRAGQRLMLVGFGVGYSWGACLVDW